MTDIHHHDKASRGDNLFGVCAAIGDDFGFDPLWLRIAFAVALLVDLEHVLMAYAALGAIVLIGRLAFRDHRPTPVVAERPAVADIPVTPAYRRAA